MRIGRYRIYCGRYEWSRREKTVIVRHLLCFWIVKEVHPTDIDKKQQFPLGTQLMYEGRRYFYYKAKDNISVGNSVERDIDNIC